MPSEPVRKQGPIVEDRAVVVAALLETVEHFTAERRDSGYEDALIDEALMQLLAYLTNGTASPDGLQRLSAHLELATCLREGVRAHLAAVLRKAATEPGLMAYARSCVSAAVADRKRVASQAMLTDVIDRLDIPLDHIRAAVQGEKD